ncbi:MAG: hypothetical protein ACTSWW_11625, partial [Promethearchaeota archaeon]
MKKRSIPKTMVLGMILTLVISMYSDTGVLSHSAGANGFEPDEPKGIRITLPDDPRSSIAISWFTYKITETEINFGMLPENLKLTHAFSADTDHVKDTYIHH